MSINIVAFPLAAATTDVVTTVNTEPFKTFGFEVKNTGAQAFDAFELWAKFSADGNPIRMAFNVTDYTSPAYPLSRAGGSPAALAAGATAWVVMDVSGFAQVVIKASSAPGGSTTLELHGNLTN